MGLLCCNIELSRPKSVKDMKNSGNRTCFTELQVMHFTLPLCENIQPQKSIGLYTPDHGCIVIYLAYEVCYPARKPSSKIPSSPTPSHILNAPNPTTARGPGPSFILRTSLSPISSDLGLSILIRLPVNCNSRMSGSIVSKLSVLVLR